MKKFIIFFSLILIFVFSLLANKLDINNASLEEIKLLKGISPEISENLFIYILEKDGLQNIFDLLDVDGIDISIYNQLKEQISIYPIRRDRIEHSFQVMRTLQSLFDEESLPLSVVDYLEDLAVRPLNVNKMTMEDFMKLPNVSAVDAAAVIRHIKTRGPITGVRQFRSARDLSFWGYRNISRFATYEDIEAVEKDKVNFIYRQMFQADNHMDASYRLLNRLRANYGSYQVGVLHEKSRNEKLEDALFKYSVEIKNELFFDKIVLGFFKISHGLGLAMDSTDGREMIYQDDSPFSTRQLFRINGLFSDLTSTKVFGLYGIGLEKNIDNNLYIYAYYSDDKKDGILNSDGTINSYYYSVTNSIHKNYKDAFNERVLGTYVKYYLPFDGFEGSHIGAGGIRISYDKYFNPDWTELIDMNTISPSDMDDDPDILKLFSGKNRNIQTADFQLVWRRWSMFGEAAHLSGAGSATNLGIRFDPHNGSYLLLLRNYNPAYDNPYARGFGERYGRFDNTIYNNDYLFKEIDLNEDGVSDYSLIANAQMKSEAGYYFQINQIRFSKYFRITHAYYDSWKSYRYFQQSGLRYTIRAENERMQGEIEFQPVMNLSFRLKHKLQKLQKNHERKSTTNETTLRAINRMSRDMYLSVEGKYGTNENIAGGKTDGKLISATYDYRFSQRFSLLTGYSFWQTDGFSMWNFDDSNFDQMEGSGYKLFLSLTNYFSDNLQLKIFVREKITKLYNESDYTYVDGSNVSSLSQDNETLFKSYITYRF